MGAWPPLLDGAAPPPQPVIPIDAIDTNTHMRMRLIRSHTLRFFKHIASPIRLIGTSIANAMPPCDPMSSEDVVAATVIAVAMFAGEVLLTVTVEFAGVHVI